MRRQWQFAASHTWQNTPNDLRARMDRSATAAGCLALPSWILVSRTAIDDLRHTGNRPHVYIISGIHV